MIDLKKYKLYTHAGCLDGSAAAILFVHAGGKKENIRFVAAGHLDEALVESQEFMGTEIPVIMVDVCPADRQVARFISARANTYVIDHHASSINFSNFPGFVIDVNNTACGSELFRRWLVEGGLTEFDGYAFKRFTQIIDDHDRWQMKIPFSLEMPKLFAFIGQAEFINRFTDVQKRFASEQESYWTDFEREIMKLVQKEQDRRYRRDLKRFVVIKREFEGQTITIGYVISAEINNSEMLNMYLTEHPEVDMACQICPDLNKVSLRSNDKVDITRFATLFGGGGHKNAGGHGLPDELTRKVAELVHGSNI